MRPWSTKWILGAVYSPPEDGAVSVVMVGRCRLTLSNPR